MVDLGNSAMVDNDGACVPTIDPRALTQLLKPGRLCQEIDVRRAAEGSTDEGDGFIAVIESRLFLRECVRRSIQTAISLPVVTYPTASELKRQLGKTPVRLVILSLTETSNEESTTACKILSDLLPKVPIIVLSHKPNADFVRTALSNGAKGYIPWTMEFEIVVQVIRFVLAGGTYVPPDIFLPDIFLEGSSGALSPQGFQEAAHQPYMNVSAASPARAALSTGSPVPSAMTRRELAVIQAIQQGKSNKLIAYHLNMCESTVKVHVRNIMRKLAAKNRTEVAIKAQSMLNAPRATVSPDAALAAA
jgi:DNA-binding NarL/FixJ family response regulator